MKISLFVCLFVCFSSANASTTVNVQAFANSTTGGTGAGNISLTAGQMYSITANPIDFWDAANGRNWSNADGLNSAPLSIPFAGFTDPSGDTSPFIGPSFALQRTQGGLTANFGSLVGEIDPGSFFFIGTSHLFTAASAGTLKLWYFDSNQIDTNGHRNSGSINVNVSAVPVPAAAWLMGTGLLGLLGMRKKRSLSIKS